MDEFIIPKFLTDLLVGDKKKNEIINHNSCL